MRSSTPRRVQSVAVALCVAASVAQASPQAQPPVAAVPLSEVVSAALARNRDLQQAQAELQKAGERIESVRAARLPKFDVSFLDAAFAPALDLRLGPFNLGLPHNFAFALGTATQPLSQLYDIGLGIEAATLSQDVAAERVRAARQAVVDEVTRAYYSCVRAQTGLQPAREAVDLFRELERYMSSLVDERAGLDSDLLEVQLRRARQEHDVLVLENALATGRERINVAMARDPDTTFSFEPIAASVPADAELAVARARVLDQRPDLRQARLSVDLAAVDVRLKKAERLPRVGAVFGYVGVMNMPLLPGSFGTALLQASWEPFDWGRKSREIAIKELTVKQAETAVAQLEATIVVELNANARALREARSLVSVTELGERAARERLRVMLDRSRERVALPKDLLQAQVSLAEAGHDYQDALLAYWDARADYEKVTGEDPR